MLHADKSIINQSTNKKVVFFWIIVAPPLIRRSAVLYQTKDAAGDEEDDSDERMRQSVSRMVQENHIKQERIKTTRQLEKEQVEARLREKLRNKTINSSNAATASPRHASAAAAGVTNIIDNEDDDEFNF